MALSLPLIMAHSPSKASIISNVVQENRPCTISTAAFSSKTYAFSLGFWKHFQDIPQCHETIPSYRGRILADNPLVFSYSANTLPVAVGVSPSSWRRMSLFVVVSCPYHSVSAGTVLVFLYSRARCILCFLHFDQHLLECHTARCDLCVTLLPHICFREVWPDLFDCGLQRPHVMDFV